MQAGGEQGLLGLAFPPDFATSQRFFVNYTAAGTGDTVVEQWLMNATDPDLPRPGSGRPVITYVQPAGNHNGGMLQFDDEGALLISTGDGGGANDSWGICGNGQNESTLLGKILRIFPAGSGTGGTADCGGAGVYTVPTDNPFFDGPGGECDEIWMTGLRNPWRFSVDMPTGDVYIGDVGQFCYEEVDWVAGAEAGGQNFGWRQMEGTRCFDPNASFDCNASAVTCGDSPDCNDPSLTLPVVDHPDGCSVIGGYVYRGCRMPDLRGTYFYGDHCLGAVRSFRIAGGVATDRQDWTAQVNPFGALSSDLSSFGIDNQGEVYLIDQSGDVLKLAPPFGSIEVSGLGAPALLAAGDGWTWEDVAYDNLIPVSYYRVYRGAPADAFECVHSSATPDWAEGDPVQPAPGELLAYLVTAVDASGVETSSGTPPRILTNPCPAP